MARGCSTVLLLFALTIVGQALTPSSYFNAVDQERLRSVFEAAYPYTDLASAHYSIMGLRLLGVEVPNAEEVCNYLKANMDYGSLEALFYAGQASRGLNKCQLAVGAGKQTLTDGISDSAKSINLYYAIVASKLYGVAVDSAKAIKAISAALKADDSPQSAAYAFLAGAEVSGDVSKLFDSIEDVIAQADEVDEKYLQFEAGLFSTALVIDGSYKLATAAKKAPTIDAEKVVKFTNYFLSRKHVHQLKTAAHLVSVIKTLTSNQYHIPVAVTLSSPVSVSKEKSTVQVRVSDLLGSSLGKMTVTADTARNMGDDAVVMSKKQLTVNKQDSALYELDFMQAKPPRGFYSISLTVNPAKADKRLVGTTGAEVNVKVTTSVAIENVEIGIADKDQTTAGKTTKLQHPKKAAIVFEADFHQRITMKFQLKDVTNNDVMTAHQTFIRLTNQKTKQEIVFVAEPDNADVYRFDLDVGSSAKDFGWLSGKYSMDLIVGDAVIENPLAWTVADVKLSFPEGSAPKSRERDPYKPRDQIEHMFRPAEKRPPGVVSNAFTILVLTPLLLLVVLWMKVGVNVSNFPMSLSAVGFHIGLGAIFGLYYLYWVQLNMFTTLRYLGIIGLPTFLFGNRLLSGIAAKRK